MGAFTDESRERIGDHRVWHIKLGICQSKRSQDVARGRGNRGRNLSGLRRDGASEKTESFGDSPILGGQRTTENRLSGHAAVRVVLAGLWHSI